ncbi:hypothetical protein ACIFOT_13085 [Neobacillus sp. NRS-1170]|uniref:hypothetical protein n=1 Tax=Neobacillus sp. NRS-1170 TaxID=3233898 RepID=UPI003D2A19FE
MMTQNRMRYLPAPLTRPRITHEWLPNGIAGTKRTVERIAKLIKHGSHDFYVRQAAIDIILRASVSAKSYLEEINTLFRWVQRNIRYTKDPYRLELISSALRILQLQIGDVMMLWF